MSKIAILTNKGVLFIATSKISYLEAEGKHTHIHNEEETIFSIKSLKMYEDELKKLRFFRCHNKYLVNLDHIKEYRIKTGEILIDNKQPIKVACRRKKELIKKITNI